MVHIESMQKLWGSKEPTGLKQRTEMFAAAWNWVRGDETQRPNRAVIRDDWLEIVDQKFGESFISDKNVESSPRSEVAMMLGQRVLAPADEPDYATARQKYIAGVIEVTKELASGAQANQELTADVKKLFEQLPFKVAIVLCVAEPTNDWRPWFPLLTRKVYWTIDQQLQTVPEAITEVRTEFRVQVRQAFLPGINTKVITGVRLNGPHWMYARYTTSVYNGQAREGDIAVSPI